MTARTLTPECTGKNRATTLRMLLPEGVTAMERVTVDGKTALVRNRDGRDVGVCGDDCAGVNADRADGGLWRSRGTLNFPFPTLWRTIR